MLWEMVSGAADMEEDEGRMKAAAAWPQCERKEGLLPCGKKDEISRSLMFAGGRSCQLQGEVPGWGEDPGSGSRVSALERARE